MSNHVTSLPAVHTPHHLWSLPSSVHGNFHTSSHTLCSSHAPVCMHFWNCLIFSWCSVFKFMVPSVENTISLLCLANYRTSKTLLMCCFLQEACPAHHYPQDKWGILSLLPMTFIILELLAKGLNSLGSIKSSLADGGRIGSKAVSGCVQQMSCGQLSQRISKGPFTWDFVNSKVSPPFSFQTRSPVSSD